MIKEIPGYGGYKASDGDDGAIFTKYGKQLNTVIDNHGYACVRINHKLVRKHLLLARTFIPNPDNLPIVNHKDGDKTHSYVSNLEWCTHSYNTQHAYDNGLITADVEHMREIAKLSSGGKTCARLYGKSVEQCDMDGNVIKVFDNITLAGRETGITASGISRCCKGEYHQYKGYIWRYHNGHQK